MSIITGSFFAISCQACCYKCLSNKRIFIPIYLGNLFVPVPLPTGLFLRRILYLLAFYLFLINNCSPLAEVGLVGVEW